MCILAPGNQDWWGLDSETVALAPAAVSEAALLGRQEKSSRQAVAPGRGGESDVPVGEAEPPVP